MPQSSPAPYRPRQERFTLALLPAHRSRRLTALRRAFSPPQQLPPAAPLLIAPRLSPNPPRKQLLEPTARLVAVLGPFSTKTNPIPDIRGEIAAFTHRSSFEEDPWP